MCFDTPKARASHYAGRSGIECTNAPLSKAPFIASNS
jgi:hypothetical protein